MSLNDNETPFPIEVRNDTEKTTVQFAVNELITNLWVSVYDRDIECTCGAAKRRLASALLGLAHKCDEMAHYCVEKSREIADEPASNSLVCTVINTALDKRCEVPAIATIKMSHKSGGVVHGFHACEFHAEQLADFAKACNMNLEYTTFENKAK